MDIEEEEIVECLDASKWGIGVERRDKERGGDACELLGGVVLGYMWMFLWNDDDGFFNEDVVTVFLCGICGLGFLEVDVMQWEE